MKAYKTISNLITTVNRVAFKAPFFRCMSILILGFYASHASAQDTSNKVIDTSKIAINEQSQSPILQLEDTIRGNREQPQVLTIVPWQLPLHQRIKQNNDWEIHTTQLPLLERSAFLKELALKQSIR